MNNTLDLDKIRQHWQQWASEFGADLRATTKSSTAKLMEINALSRSLAQIQMQLGSSLSVLEMGCGNGSNCLALAEQFPECSFLGLDYIEDMISAANYVKKEHKLQDARVSFDVADVLNLSLPEASFDVVFTDRCLINLNSDSLQKQAISALSKLVKPGGYLLMIENSHQTYTSQNRLRESVGLSPRTPAEFNHFFNDDVIVPFLCEVGLQLVDVEDFITLHDIVLYVLVPMINGGKVDYNHPIVKAAAQVNCAASALQQNSLGQFGQNRLYKCRK